MASEVSIPETLKRVNALLTARGDKEITWTQWVDFNG